MSQSLTHAGRFPPCQISHSLCSLPASDFVQRRRGKQRNNASRLGRPPFAVPQSRSQLLRNPWLLNRGCRRPSFVARCSRNWGCAEIENRSRHTKPETGLRRLEYVACRNCNIAKPHFGEIAHRRGCSSSAFFALNVVLRFFTEASKPHFAPNSPNPKLRIVSMYTDSAFHAQAAREGSVERRLPASCTRPCLCAMCSEY